MQIVLANTVANPFLLELKIEGKAPHLVGILATSDPFARTYARFTAKTCESIGAKFTLIECSRGSVEDVIVKANSDPSIHGIMVYYPIFNNAQDQYLQNTVAVEKDVEGLCHKYRYNMYHNIRFLDSNETKKCIIPCTPLAIVKILEHCQVYNKMLLEGNRLHGKTITVINRSEVVGRPLAALLANDGAKVFSVDLDGILEFHRGESLALKKHEIFETKVTLEEALKASDVVITGVPSESYKLPLEPLKDGVILVNFSSFKNIDEEGAKKKAALFVPSVGKCTVIMLLRNLIRLYSYLPQ